VHVPAMTGTRFKLADRKGDVHSRAGSGDDAPDAAGAGYLLDWRVLNG